MKLQTFIRRTRIEASAAEVFAWHALPGALEKLTPPWEPVRIIERGAGIKNGSRVVLEIKFWPLRFRWISEHRDYQEGRSFTDVQTSGPFAYWKHTHSFEPIAEHACVLKDRIEYALPLGIIAKFLAGWWVHRKLDRLFQYRHAITLQELGALRRRTQLSPKSLYGSEMRP
jgi:hypothetical protein